MDQPSCLPTYHLNKSTVGDILEILKYKRTLAFSFLATFWGLYDHAII